MTPNTARVAGDYEIVVHEEGISGQDLSGMCRKYFDQEAAEYDRFDHEVERRRRYTVAVDDFAAMRLKALDWCGRLLSFGCGTGRREVGIAAVLGTSPEIVAVETSPAMKELALRRGIHVLPALDVREVVRPGSFDAALCLSSFVHLPSAESRMATLRLLHEALVPDAPLVLDVFNIDDRFEWGSNLLDYAPGEAIGLARGDVLYRRLGREATSYMHYFSCGEVVTLVEAAGFVVETLQAVGYMRHPGRLGVPLNEGCLLLTCRKREQ